MKEIVVISGKGGTGKTTITGAFAALAPKPVVADCDVDAADLHLILSPSIRERESFSGGKLARIKTDDCTACGKCKELCRFDAVFFDGPGNNSVPKTYRIDPLRCEGCGVCAWFCEERAIEFELHVNGEIYISDTRFGPMIHARLGIAAENSGKMVSRVRTLARERAALKNRALIISDGSPGIGCPVIASVTGADVLVMVTEPTLSGQHDLERILDLAGHFGLPSLVVVNKWTINEDITARIEKRALEKGASLAGRIRYDRTVVDAMVAKMTVVEMGISGAADDIAAVWDVVNEYC